jgi:hypothetical protein
VELQLLLIKAEHLMAAVAQERVVLLLTKAAVLVELAVAELMVVAALAI